MLLPKILLSSLISNLLASDLLHTQSNTNILTQFNRPSSSIRNKHRFKRDLSTPDDDQIKLEFADSTKKDKPLKKPFWDEEKLDQDKIKNCDASLNPVNDVKNLKITSSENGLHDDNPSVSIAWHGDNTGVVLAVTSKDTFEGFLDKHSGSKVYRSVNFGKSFQDVTARVASDVGLSGPEKLHIRKSGGVINMNLDTKKVILLRSHSLTEMLESESTDDKDVLYINEDVTNSDVKWTKIELPFKIEGSKLEQHPFKKDHFLTVAVGSRDEHSLWMTTDGGYNWQKIDVNVYRYRWDPRPKAHSGHMDAHDTYNKEHDTENAFYYTKDQTGMFQKHSFNYELFRGQNWSSEKKGNTYMLAVEVYSFGVQDRFLYVSVLYKGKNKLVGNRIMLVSNDHGADLKAVQLPDINHDQFYAILDASEGMIFIHVDDEGDTGHGKIYTSGPTGDIFDMSLEHHLYPNSGDVTDFYKVDAFGSNGTYITSQLQIDQENAIQTKITYDRGVSWHDITHDMIDGFEKGMGKDCTDDVCNLQIHNRFSISKAVHVPRGPVSSKNAPGLILAHANVGDALAGKNVNVYVTEDGGYKWRKSLDGAYSYSIMNHGKVLVAIPSPELGDRRVDTIKISLNRGRCWFDYRFTDQPIDYTGIIHEPGDKQDRLSVWGWGNETDENPEGNWMLYHIELQLDQCGSEDFTLTKAHCDSKSRGGDGECCRLGEQVSYTQVKRDRACVVDVNFAHNYDSKACKCQKDDYMCGYGWFRVDENDPNSECKKQVDDTTGSVKLNLKYDICLTGKGSESQKELYGNHLLSSQYRKLPGDRCLQTGPGAFRGSPVSQEKRFLVCEIPDELSYDERGNEGDLNALGTLDKNCVTRDQLTNKCVSQEDFEKYLRGEMGDIWANADNQSGDQGKGGHSFLWGFLIIGTLIACAYYRYGYQRHELPGFLQNMQFHNYSHMNNRLTIEEDEPPLDLGNEYQNDEDDILG